MNAKEQLAAWIHMFGRIPTLFSESRKIVRYVIGLGDNGMPTHIPLGVIPKRDYKPNEYNTKQIAKKECRIEVSFGGGELTEEQCDEVLRRMFQEA